MHMRAPSRQPRPRLLLTVVVLAVAALALVGCEAQIPGLGGGDDGNAAMPSSGGTPTPVKMLDIVTPTPGAPPPTPNANATPGNTTPPEGAPPSDATTYVVQPGDTLFGIAAKLNVPVKALEEENGITDADSLQAGQILKIPR